MAPSVTLIRGISGSGKTTLAATLAGAVGSVLAAADDYFLDELGEYSFNPSLLPQAHAHCLTVTRNALDEGRGIVVHNTFCERWEMQPYLDLAKQYGCQVTVASVYDGGRTDEELASRNEHGVPLAAIAGMRARWEVDWKMGNPLPPWER